MNARSLAAGLAGALTLNALSEAAHRLAPPDVARRAPRLDRLGTAALAKVFDLDIRPDREAEASGPVYTAALGLDVAVNAVGYAFTVGGADQHPVRRGFVVGALSGAATVAGAHLIDRGQDVSRRPATPWLTVLWYAVGGAAAGLAIHALTDSDDEAD